MHIIILQAGWVLVGTYEKQGEMVRVIDCAVIRRWGTDKGLGQLAITGPTDNTRLDPCPEWCFHESVAIGYMKVICSRDLWKY